MDNVTGYSRLKIGLVSVIISFICLLVFLFLYSLVEMSRFQLGLSIVALVFISGGITSVFLHKIFMKNMDLITNVIHEMEDIVTVKEYNGDYVFCNKRLAYLYGSTPDEMIGKNDYFFDRHRDQADAFLESLQSVINKFEKETVSESLYDIDTGRKQHLCSTKIPFRDTQKQP